MAVGSLLACTVAYRLADLWPSDTGTGLLMFGIPTVLTFVLGSSVAFALLRMGAALTDHARSLESEVERRLAAEHQLEILANQDDLTGLANRRAFFAHAESVAATGRPSCVAVIDLDNFKVLNDTHGHATGDAVLRDFGALLRRGCCAGAFVGRLGGEEFGVIVPTDECEDIVAEMDRLRRQVHALRPAVTISAGVAAWSPAESDTIDAALVRADAGLYRAKQLGRDRIEQVVGREGTGPVSSDLAPVARRR